MIGSKFDAPPIKVERNEANERPFLTENKENRAELPDDSGERRFDVELPDDSGERRFDLELPDDSGEKIYKPESPDGGDNSSDISDKQQPDMSELKETEPATKDVSEAAKEPIQNKKDGLRREKEVETALEDQYSPEEGYTIISETYLRDKDGNIVKDPETGEARRIDFVVVKDGEVVDSIEVTSMTADKGPQSAKEARIRNEGGNYIRDGDGNLVYFPSSVQTRIERRD